MTNSNAVPGRDTRGRFAAGNPGRPFGTRNRVSARVARTILADFERNQTELLVRMRRWFLPQYLSLISRLLPRDGEGEAVGGLAEDLTLADLRAVIDRVEADGGTLADLEAAIGAAITGPVNTDSANSADERLRTTIPGPGADIIGR
jgi:hypothetical protein